ncbi:LytR/AlgR family response regulator transcription factor [Portibacter marinus]|uniref:LytR/AlgR family response regulator transcription factor n=1 Tax=Portibacter marinus TaxID=2898660 RepID=UPI001F39E504|nr:LytTR family DNA-binding domain-containing protein [Portibacter marinus]
MKILIIEDERSIASRLERLLRSILQSKIEKLEIRAYIEGGLDYIQQHEIDLLFLDLNLNGQDGFEILKTLLAESFQTIIVSAYKEKAIEAFEYGVVDFVPKPFDKDRLEKALSRIHQKPDRLHSLIIKKQGQLKIIPLHEIIYIKGANIYSEIYTDSNPKELSNKTLDQLSKMLPRQFVRIHKSYIADLNRATKIRIQPGSKYELILENNLILPIGRTKYKSVKKQMVS